MHSWLVDRASVQLILKHAAGFWRLEDKIGLPLKDIHLKGGVYQYKEKLQLSLDRYTDLLNLKERYLTREKIFSKVAC